MRDSWPDTEGRTTGCPEAVDTKRARAIGLGTLVITCRKSMKFILKKGTVISIQIVDENR